MQKIFPLCIALVAVLWSALTTSVRAAHYELIFREDFEEATFGGTYTPPAGNTTGISPTLGTWTQFINDNGVITNGLAGSTKSLAGIDLVGGLSLRVVGTGFAATNQSRVSFDFRVGGTPAGVPIEFYLNSGPFAGGTTFLGFLLLPDLTLLTTDSSSALFSGAFNHGTLASGNDYRVMIYPTLASDTYDIVVTNLTSATLLSSQTGLDFIPVTTFQAVDFRFGGPDPGVPVFLDNLEVANLIPEPSTVLLLLAGGGLLWQRVRRTHVA